MACLVRGEHRADAVPGGGGHVPTGGARPAHAAEAPRKVPDGAVPGRGGVGRRLKARVATKVALAERNGLDARGVARAERGRVRPATLPLKRAAASAATTLPFKRAAASAATTSCSKTTAGCVFGVGALRRLASAGAAFAAAY